MVQNPLQWVKIKSVLGQALDLDECDRSSFLDGACRGEADVRAEVESLLAAYSEGDAFSKQTWVAALSDDIEPPKTIGPYRLQRELGAGGMGEVWLAEQTEPVHRSVALKLIRAGIYDATLLRRFLSERQSLALMNHPAIAKVFDAGATPAGQPYLVMEYVEGLPLTAYCDEKRLGVPERLRLFQQVCEGVQHAHQKAIIHRDLKPSNILVLEIDGKPAPRIIDFGLAKSAAPALVDEKLLTQVGAFLGTPGYMSPEQLEPGSQDLDTRADVYSLGVVLYELLTGSLPFDPQRWKKQRFDEVLREIREIDAPLPSTQVRGSEGRTSASRAQLARSLRGDLDSITLKALEKNRDRRYGTPMELAADIERHLGNRPVKARAASRRYRFGRYIRRNRIAVTVGVAALALLVAFAVTQSVELRRITRERDRADRISQFMSGMFKSSDPYKARGNTVTAREILDKASRDIRTGLANDPELQADLMQVMGRVYGNLGLPVRARPLLESSVRTRRRVLGPEDPKTLVSMDDLARVLDDGGQAAEAAELQAASLAIRRRVQGPDHNDVRKSMANLATFFVDSGRVAEAEKLNQEVLAMSIRTLGPHHRDTLGTMNNLAGDYIHEERYREAKPLLSQALEDERKSPGPDDPLTLASMNNLAVVLLQLGQLTEAEKLQEETREIQIRVLGENHHDTAGSTYNLAIIAERQGNREKALALLRDTVNHGFTRTESLAIKDDPDLKSMHDDPRFQALLADVQKQTAATRKEKR